MAAQLPTAAEPAAVAVPKYALRKLALAAHFDGVQPLIKYVEAQHHTTKGAAAKMLDSDVRLVDNGCGPSLKAAGAAAAAD
jgi:hypothetical protein